MTQNGSTDSLIYYGYSIRMDIVSQQDICWQIWSKN